MSFDSVTFLVFFPVVTTLYFLFPHGYRAALLLAASVIFYMAFIPSYIFILCVTIVVDYLSGRLIETSRSRHLFLILSILVNVGFLAFFKYFNFINENLSLMAGVFHQSNPISNLNILLPIGLSFHTFQAMSYTIEVYKGRQKAERNFGIFALYVLFYPQLVAGPIERPQNLLHQFYEKHLFDYDRVVSGLKLMAWGFFKKIVIANGMAPLANPIYNQPHGQSGLAFLFATICFSFQIYADFSGYTDIARGAARVMGFSLMENFRSPYLSSSISQFWTRWHISLSTWFRDYVYLPLGGNRVPFWRWQTNLLIVFLISGLWHGAKWTFVIWGLLHASYLITEHGWRRWGKATALPLSAAAREKGSTVLVFGAVTLAWIFFRANHVSDAFYIVTHLGHNWTWPAVRDLFHHGPVNVYMMVALAIFLLWAESTQGVALYERVIRPNAKLRWASYYVLITAIFFLGTFGNNRFIYFQF
jgi:D-alanyl-lipoteichoic acid acyltransferase DltB (MBOAT superfamily)